MEEEIGKDGDQRTACDNSPQCTGYMRYIGLVLRLLRDILLYRYEDVKSG